MSYSANQYNYATPLSSASSLVQETSGVNDAKYFTLFDNKLDGSYAPITGDVGLWGTVISDADGVLSSPLEVTVVSTEIVKEVRVIGGSTCFPVDFTITCYNGAEVVGVHTETGNTKAEYLFYLASDLDVTSYTISISKISSANNVARLYNVYVPLCIRVNSSDIHLIKSTGLSSIAYAMTLNSADMLNVSTAYESKPITVEFLKTDSMVIKETNKAYIGNTLSVNDALRVRNNERLSIINNIDIADDIIRTGLIEGRSNIHNTIGDTIDRMSLRVVADKTHILNTIDKTFDTLHNHFIEVSHPTNIHTVMKSPSRRVYGKVYVTYTDPMLDTVIKADTSAIAYNSDTEQLFDGIIDIERRLFTLYDNDLTGAYTLSNQYDQVGWVSSEISDANGTFVKSPYIEVSFNARPVLSLIITFDDSHDNLVKDFTVTFTNSASENFTYAFTNNTQRSVDILNGVSLADIVSVRIEVHRVARPFSPAVIVDLPISSTMLYKGYQDISNLLSVDLLEELTYEDEIEALGGVSANEVTVKLDNSNKDFFIGSGSAISKQLRRNRKIVPYLGAEIVPGEIEWYSLGTFWSYKWDVPANGLHASVVGFDTIGLLGLTDYTEHTVQINKSIGELLDYVLSDAAKQLSFLEYDIDEALYDIVIPYAWFSRSSHAAALRRISMCYPMHIYCDRQGRVCAKPQKLRLDYYHDIWSDSTNIISKNYSSLYTVLPNVVNVTINNIIVKENAELVKDDSVYTVHDGQQVTLNFNAPYLENISVDVICEDTLQYTYKAYSWGIEVTFEGTGIVESIVCTGTCLDSTSQTIITNKDETSVRLNGAVTRNVAAEFIQTSELANLILDRLFSLSDLDKFDASVTYRGDIALSINDPILLQGGLAPDNRYNIKRHELHWNGALSGSAELNT